MVVVTSLCELCCSDDYSYNLITNAIYIKGTGGDNVQLVSPYNQVYKLVVKVMDNSVNYISTLH